MPNLCRGLSRYRSVIQTDPATVLPSGFFLSSQAGGLFLFLHHRQVVQTQLRPALLGINLFSFFLHGSMVSSGPAQLVSLRCIARCYPALFDLPSTKLIKAEHTTNMNFASLKSLFLNSINACRIPPSSDV